jgi:hypothetical protein
VLSPPTETCRNVKRTEQLVFIVASALLLSYNFYALLFTMADGADSRTQLSLYGICTLSSLAISCKLIYELLAAMEKFVFVLNGVYMCVRSSSINGNQISMCAPCRWEIARSFDFDIYIICSKERRYIWTKWARPSIS